MKIIKFGFLLAMLLFSTQIFAQTDVENIVIEGMEFHDNGDYDKAIETYKKALKIDKKSPLVHYEIALSYFSKGNYNEAVKYSDVVIKKDKELMLEAYMIKGSALDLLGKTKESIQLFKNVLKEEKHYLLYYNLSFNYFKLKDYENAEENVIKAIELNPNHATSHLMLAHIHDRKGNSVQALLASHFFLFLEPNSPRSIEGYDMLMESFRGNVTKGEGNSGSTKILYSPSNDSLFSAMQMMISILGASKSLEKYADKTDDEMFVENTRIFFKVLGELNDDKNKEIWFTLYTTFFYDLAQSEHLETYCKYITQSENENSREWLEENQSKLYDFDKWLSDN